MVEAIKASEAGMTSRDLAKRFGLKMNTITQHMHIARTLGHVLVTRSGGPSPIWYTEGHSEVVRLIQERREAKAKALKAKHQRQYKRRLAEARRASELIDSDPERESMPIVRSWVNAADVAPIYPKGPISVFHLGQQ